MGVSYPFFRNCNIENEGHILAYYHMQVCIPRHRHLHMHVRMLCFFFSLSFVVV